MNDDDRQIFPHGRNIFFFNDFSDVSVRFRRRGRRVVLCEKRYAKPHSVVLVRSVQQPGNQRVAVHHGRSVSHQHEVRNSSRFNSEKSTMNGGRKIKNNTEITEFNGVAKLKSV